jgi:hypothetical protein
MPATATRPPMIQIFLPAELLRALAISYSPHARSPGLCTLNYTLKYRRG